MECFAPHRTGQNMARASKVPNTNIGLKPGYFAPEKDLRPPRGERSGDFGNSFLEKGAELGFAGTMDNIHAGEFSPSRRGCKGRKRRGGAKKKGENSTQRTTIQVHV
jgi:hypothetical protein